MPTTPVLQLRILVASFIDIKDQCPSLPFYRAIGYYFHSHDCSVGVDKFSKPRELSCAENRTDVQNKAQNKKQIKGFVTIPFHVSWSRSVVYRTIRFTAAVNLLQVSFKYILGMK